MYQHIFAKAVFRKDINVNIRKRRWYAKNKNGFVQETGIS
jgi:hypothetical protein